MPLTARWVATVVVIALATSPGSVFFAPAAAASPADVALQHYLKASNTEANDELGYSVAVAANSATESTVVVGARLEKSCATGVDGSQTDNACSNAGSAYVFSCSTSSGGTCTQLAYLKASNTDAGDEFGWSVAVAAHTATESTVVVGAPSEDSCSTGVDGNQTDNACIRAGSGYVFSCSSFARTCTQLAYLKASNTGADDRFGSSVAVAAHTATESTVVVGARFEASCATGVDGSQTNNACGFAGSGYVFSCSSSSGGTCTQLAYLKASNTGAGDGFGWSAAVAANSATESTVVVGAWFEDSCATGVDGSQTDNACTWAGSAYVFSCNSSSGGTCTPLASLKGSNTGAGDTFGDSVAVAANSATESTVVVGAPSEDSCSTGVNGSQTNNACISAGSGYVFSCSTSSGGTCMQLAYLKASNTGAGDRFGASVAVAANSATESTVVVGAYWEASCATGVNGSQTNNACSAAGSAYVFSCRTSSGGTCTQLAYLKASNTGAGDRFGASVAVAANSATESTVVVGAYGEDSCTTGVDGGNGTDNNCFSAGGYGLPYGAGSAYMFTSLLQMTTTGTTATTGNPMLATSAITTAPPVASVAAGRRACGVLLFSLLASALSP